MYTFWLHVMHLLCTVHDSSDPAILHAMPLVAKVLMGSNARVCYTTLVNNGQRICVARECKQHCTGDDWLPQGRRWWHDTS